VCPIRFEVYPRSCHFGRKGRYARAPFTDRSARRSAKTRGRPDRTLPRPTRRDVSGGFTKTDPDRARRATSTTSPAIIVEHEITLAREVAICIQQRHLSTSICTYAPLAFCSSKTGLKFAKTRILITVSRNGILRLKK